MKRFKLLKEYTSDQKLNCIFSLIFLIFSFSSTSFGQEVSGARPLSDHQFNTQRCDTKALNARNDKREFKKACAEAKLGGLKSCEDKLKQCATSPEKKTFCLSDATSAENDRENTRDAQDRERDLQDRKDDLQDRINDNERELEEVRRAVDAADQELQETLSNIDAERAQAQIQLNQELDSITEQVAQQKEAITTAELQFREFILANTVTCRERAAEVRANFIERHQQRKREGRQATLNQAQLFNRAGQSLNEQGSVLYNQQLRICTSRTNDKGQLTPFGDAYKQQRDLIRLRQRGIRRTIATLQRQRVITKRGMLATMRNLDARERDSLSQNQRAKLAAIETQERRTRQNARLQAELSQLNGQIRIAGFAIEKKQLDGILNRGKRRKKIKKVANQSEIDAFNLALSFYDDEQDVDLLEGGICNIQQEHEKAQKELKDKGIPTINAIAIEKAEKEAKKAAEKKKKAKASKKKAKSSVGQTVGRPQ